MSSSNRTSVTKGNENQMARSNDGSSEDSPHLTSSRGVSRHSRHSSREERRRVRFLANLGVPLEHIASLVSDGIGEETLEREYHQELAAGRAEAIIKVTATLQRLEAIGQNVAAGAFLLRNANGVALFMPRRPRNDAKMRYSPARARGSGGKLVRPFSLRTEIEDGESIV